MGMHVSQLRSVPVGAFEWYVYVVDASGGNRHTSMVDRAFERFARSSGPDAVIVTGPPNLSQELTQFLSRHAGAAFGPLERLFHEVSCLVVSRGALQNTSEQVYVVPLLTNGGSEGDSDSTVVLDAILEGLLNAMHDNRVVEFLTNLHATPIELSDIRQGMLITTLRHVNQYLQLQPNFYGLGVNLNAVVERIVGPAVRDLPQP
jgi:hypothetical protein